MLDIQFIRENPETVRDAIKNKQMDVDLDRLLEADEKRRKLLAEEEDLRHQRKQVSAVGARPSEADIEQGKRLKQKLDDAKSRLQTVEQEYQTLLESVPNVISSDTPIGVDENDNQTISSWGDVPEFDFPVRDHVQLGEGLGVLDSKRAAKISGARFVFLKGELALLQFALLQFVLQSVTNPEIIAKLIKENDLQLEPTPFTAVVPPALVRPETMQRMARLEPKDERFFTLGEEFALVGSAEHSIGALYMDEILDPEQLPVRLIGYSSSFRREAGSYGKDTRGILRLHQFDKMEMETFSTAETGPDEHRLSVALQEYFMQSLKLPYRKVAICSGDMGAPDFQQTDLEAWLPGQGAYRETHTADYMTDYQSRRLKTRYRDGKQTRYVHMNDATACAVGRTLIAIMENYQTREGTILIPEVLQPWMPKEEIA